MSRRVSLPGADELFRTTGGSALQGSQPRNKNANGEAGTAQNEARLRSVPNAPADEGRAPGGGTGDGGPQSAGSGPAEHSGRDGMAQPRQAQPLSHSPAPASGQSAAPVPAQQPRRKGPRPGRRPSGRERHDEKITVYVSAEELMDLEHARLVLRGEHGLAIDRGRIVREAVAVVLADLESRGDASILVRRLRGR